MRGPWRWRGINISQHGASELFYLYDIAQYLEALRDGRPEPGIPEDVDPVIKDECRILLEKLEPFRTDRDVV